MLNPSTQRAAAVWRSSQDARERTGHGVVALSCGDTRPPYLPLYVPLWTPLGPSDRRQTVLAPSAPGSMAAASAQRATLANVQEKHTVRAERKKDTTAIGTLQEQQHNFPSRMKSGTLEGLFFVSRQQSLRFSRHSRAASLPLSVDRAAHYMSFKRDRNLVFRSMYTRVHLTLASVMCFNQKRCSSPTAYEYLVARLRI